MVLNIKLAIRNMMKNKVISFINLFGLSVGITCCLLIIAYIINELSYDKYNKNAVNTYRVERTFYNPENKTPSLELGTIAPPFGPLLQNDFKEIKDVTRLLNAGPLSVKFEEKLFNENNAYFADEHLFNIFDVSMITGNPEKALKDPYAVLLSEPVAKKYFGDQDPINKVIKVNNKFDCKVSGIYKPFPQNAHIHPDMMVSFNTLRDSAVYGEKQLETNFGNNSFYTYILLPDHYDPKKLEAQLPAFINRHLPDKTTGAFKNSDGTSLQLRKLTDIHLYAHTDLEAEENGDIKRVYIFSAIALFILLIACINYMNLSTARSVLRAKEIGIRKVSGAQRSELIIQFLSESVIICFIATIIALILARIAMPWLSSLSGTSLEFNKLLQPFPGLLLLVVPFLVGSIAGLYPALFLSSFKPVKVLKGILTVGGKGISLRKALVIVQFAISIILIISTIIVFSQLKYMQNKSLGYNRDQMVILPYSSALNNSFNGFRTELLAFPGIKEVGRSSRIPSGRLLDEMGSSIDRGDSLTPVKSDIKFVAIDAGFFPAYGIKFMAGRNFYPKDQEDSNSFILNEAAIKALQVPSDADAIGKRFQYGPVTGTIKGVVNDFHFESLHQHILPMVFFKASIIYNNISVKVSGNAQAALSHIENTWKKYLPEIPYQYNFLDERYENLYRSEQKQGTLFTAFSIIAIFIACLGLFGLSSFMISQRIKEIGIRKVLGAETANIVGLLSIDFMKLVGIAALIAFPAGWYIMHKWLLDFAYRISIPWWVFFLAGLVAALVAFVTISFQAIKAALANPVKNLRTE